MTDRRPTALASWTRLVLVTVLGVTAAGWNGGLGASGSQTAAQVPVAAPPSAGDLAARIQAKYATVKDFTADFTLAQTSGLMPRATTERGTVQIKKPLRMRWVYTSGARQQFVSDGAELYSYFPQDKYVAVSRLPQGPDASTALLFLAGKGDLTRDFGASLAAVQPSGEWHLVLTPKASTADFQTLTLEVDRRVLTLLGIVVVDTQGGRSQFRFANLRENRGLDESIFAFRIPKGVELVRR